MGSGRVTNVVAFPRLQTNSHLSSLQRITVFLSIRNSLYVCISVYVYVYVRISVYVYVYVCSDEGHSAHTTPLHQSHRECGDAVCGRVSYVQHYGRAILLRRVLLLQRCKYPSSHGCCCLGAVVD